MNLEQVTNTIEREFEFGWESRTPIEFENLKYKPTLGQPWVRLSVMESRVVEVELGRVGTNIRKRHYGTVFIEVFRPAYRGKDTDNLVNDASKILELRTLAGEITLDASSVQTIGEVTNGAWYLKLIRVPYWFDEIIIKTTQ